MAININWPTGVIYVPQADLTLISGTLYELDTDSFRLELKSLEDDEEGMPWKKTHSHNTEVVVAGVTYSRTIEIINGYSVEFEDGQYSVRLVGSNNNIFDIQNGILVQNQVQVIPTNSAGLQSVNFNEYTVQELASAVWDEPIDDHLIADTTGAWLKKKVLTVAKFIGLK